MNCNQPIDRIPDALWADAIEAYLDYVGAIYAMDHAQETPPNGGQPATVQQMLARAYAYLKDHPDNAYALKRTAELNEEYRHRLDYTAEAYDRFRECIGAMLAAAEEVMLQRVRDRAQAVMQDEWRQIRGYPGLEGVNDATTEKAIA